MIRRLVKKLTHPAGAEKLTPPPTDTVQLGTHAERLLSDPVLLLAFDRVGEKLAKTWEASAATDSAGRELVYAQRKALDRVKSELIAFLGNKQIVEAEMKREAQKAAA